ncbi:winged helix-turn-helix domain-containing protein [Roseomonas sp. CCTCC AB2023176]|uniref:winged helix-turn-helix domain-containing protein n=1 Tax=Roseomonas sp. CCTCC AB2023176 TaxID=3342640 RepID=UPI0035E07D2A
MNEDSDGDDLAFGNFTLRRRDRALLADGAPVELGGRAFDLLATLAGGRGALLTKDALLRQVWPGAIVEENNLHTQIGAVRRALGPARDAIVTVPGRGYRFVLPVTSASPAGAPAAVAPVRLSVLVLPFLTHGDDAMVTGLAEGVLESLTTDLSRTLAGGVVISRTTASLFGDRRLSARAIGEELGVRYVLEGSVTADGPRLRVNAQLIDAAADIHVWAERFDTLLSAGALAAQDAIVGRLARMVALRMVLAEARRAALDSVPDAGGLALQGLGSAIASRMAPQSVPAARALFRRALALDPDNVEAAAGLGTLEAYALVNGFTPEAERAERLADAEGLTNRVLAAEPEHVGALRARAVVLRAQGRFEDAIIIAQAVLLRCPGDPPACRELGLNHLYLGAPEEAVHWFSQAELSGPADPARWSWLQGLGRALLQLERDAEAVAVFRMVVESSPDWSFGHGLLAVALALDGQPEAARERFADFIRHQPDPDARLPARLIRVPRHRVSPAYHQREVRLVRTFAALEQACA